LTLERLPGCRIVGVSAGLSIGEVARRTGLSPDSIRHYERLGLIPVAPRSVGGLRVYPDSAVRRVQVVQAALAVGFTLRELAAAFAERRAGRPPCRRIHSLAKAKIGDVERRIRDLQQLREALVRTLRDWDERLAHGDGPAGLLDALADAPMTGRAHETPRRRAK
jgi:MerR family transcriptional regulator, copper efflux regulator